jgi:plasmid stabilization system protein ParE
VSRAIFNRLAERELREASEHYDARSEDLGTEFLDAVRNALSLLTRYPHLAPQIHGPVHRFVLERFPYSILYRPLAGGDLRVLAIAHDKRRPTYWIRRR